MPDNRSVIRRVHVDEVRPGELQLTPQQAHHLRDVLRLDEGTELEVFDAAGTVGVAKIVSLNEPLTLQVERVSRSLKKTIVSVYSAVPKGDRADWMIEKLSELGVDRFVPLRTERSVVHPEGKGKLDRWERIAIESAKQSRRPGVMKIEPLSLLTQILNSSPSSPVHGEGSQRLFLSTAADASPLLSLLHAGTQAIDLFIGPEGGWSETEMERMIAAGLTGAKLTTTILRVETAAVAAASVVGTFFAQD